jgi:hypothetical protein
MPTEVFPALAASDDYILIIFHRHQLDLAAGFKREEKGYHCAAAKIYEGPRQRCKYTPDDRKSR